MPDEPNAIVDTDDLSNYVNDYVRLTSEYDALQEEIDDISTYTSVTPEEVETTVVVPSDVYDGLVIDNSQNTPVPEEDDINLPEDPIDTVSYITEYRTVRYQLTRYDIEFLEYLHNDGATFYAILDDDSEVEIDYNDIIPPYGERLEEVVRYDDIIAETIGMNFWNDTNGVHVSQVEKDDWLQAVTDNFSDSSLDKPYHNILMNSEGILLRRALLNLFGISRLAISFYDGTGNTANNVTASFGSTMAQIGKTNSNHVVITSNGVTAYKGDGTLDELTAIVDGVNLKNSTITGSKIASSTIENSNIKDGTITGAKIQGSTLTNIPYAEIDQLKTRNVTADAIQAATGFVSSLATNSITTATLIADHGVINNLETNFAHIQNGVIDNASINVANVNGLSANYAHITNGVIDNAKIGHADVNGLSANYASVGALSAETARVDTLVANTADLATIRANAAKVTNLTASQLEADHATVGSLSTNYAQIDMANVNNTWIQNGTIKDAAISDGMINSVSANKLTAGTIDASNITVTNLNADNITTGTINGQRIGTGSLSLDKLEDAVYTETEVDNIVSNLQTQIDGAIETWTGTAVPTLQNAPASSWTTNSIKDTHVGDVYFVVNSQSNQNGYNYRFTKSGTGNNVTYSWQLIKDSDVTNALSRLTTAEGKIGTIETFDSEIASWKTNTDQELSSIKTNHTNLAGRVTTAEGQIATKVDSTTFNTLSQTVDSNSSSIQQLTTETTTITEKITLEKPYKEVEWVETTGRQFIATDYIPGANGAFGFDADFIMRHTNYGNNQSWGAITDATATNLARLGIVFGVRQTNSDTYWQPQYAQYMLSTDPKWGSNGSLMTGGGKCNAMLYKDSERRQQCSFHNGIYTAPDGSTTTVEQTDFGVPKAGMLIAGFYQNPQASGSCNASSQVRIYSLKFYDDEVLAADFIPCVRTRDNVPGFYNSINETFYPARGALFGDFTGNELGEVDDISQALLYKDVILTDSRTANSRLLIVHTNRSKHFEDGEQLSISLQYNSASQNSTDLGIDHNFHTPNANSEMWLRVIYSDDTIVDYPMYYSLTTRLTTHYATGTIVHLTVVRDLVGNDYKNYIAKGVICDANYDTNTDTNTVTDKIANSVVAGKNGINNYSLVMKDDEGNWTSLTTTAGTATTKIAYDGPLQYSNVAYSTPNARYEPGVNSGDGIYNSYAVDIRYSTNVANNATSGLIARQPVYLIGEVHSDGYFYLDTPWWTQTVPTEEDGKTYIYLGIPYSYYQIWLAGDNTVYRFMDGEFTPVYIHTIERSVSRINEVTDTVSEHTRKLGNLETVVETKADSSTVTTVSNNLNTLSQTVNGQAQTISSLQSTVANKADGSTVTSLSSRVNDISDTVDGHTSQLSNVQSTQTTIQGSAVKSTVQLWFTKANTTAPSKPTAHVTTNNAATANAWNLAVPTYNASYPNYYYCYEYEYLNGTYGWSAVTRDIATGEMQERARTAISNAATADGKAVAAQNTADKNVKESVQLWCTKASNTAPSKPTAAVTSTATTGNAWTTRVPAYSSSYPYYFYCMQYKLADGTYTWSDVVYDQATTETQSVSRTTSSNLSTVTTQVANISDTVDGHTAELQTTTTNLTTLRTDFDNLEIGGRNLLKDTDVHLTTITTGSINTLGGTAITTIPIGSTITVSVDIDATDIVWTAGTNRRIGCEVSLAKPNNGGYQYVGVWASFAVGGNSVEVINGSLHKRISKTYTLLGDWTVNDPIRIYCQGVSSGTISVGQVKVEYGNKATDWSPAPEDLEDYADNAANAVPRMSKINTAQRTFTTDQWKTYGAYGHIEHWVSGGLDNSHLRIGDRAYLTGTISDQMRGSATIIGKITGLTPASTGVTSVSMQSEQLIFGGDAVSAIQTSLSETQTDYATFKQTTQNFESTIGSTYATKEELTTTVEQATQQYVDVEAEPFIIDDDGINAPLRSIEANGWSEQFTTTGKNLLPREVISSSVVSGVTFKENPDGSFTANGTATADIGFSIGHTSPNDSLSEGTYTLSGCPAGGSQSTYSLRYFNNNTNISTYDYGNGGIRTLTSDQASKWNSCWVYIMSGITVNNLTFYPQLELGSTATAYEPYTGGAPSPSPSYPQEIKVARGRNLLPLLGYVDRTNYNGITYVHANDGVKISGTATANSFNVSNMSQSVTAILTPNTYVLSFDAPNGSGILVSLKGRKLSDNSSVNILDYGSSNRTFTISESHEVYIIIMVPNGKVIDTTLHVQLEAGSTPTPYVPYGCVGLEVLGRNLWGGEALDDAFMAAGGNHSYGQGTVAISGGTVTGKELYSGPFKNNTRYTLVLAGYNTSSNYVTWTNLRIYYTDGTYDDAIRFGLDGAQNFIVTTAGKTVRSISGVHAAYVSVFYIDRCGLFEGEITASEYEPYSRTATPILLPERGWVGSLADGVDNLSINQSGTFDWSLSTQKVIFDGSTRPVNAPTVNTNSTRISSITPLSDIKLRPEPDYTAGIVSSHFIADSIAITNQSTAPIGKIAVYTNKYVYFTFDKTLTTAAAINAWLQSNPVTVIYPLAESIIESGRITMPTVYPGCTVSIPELDEVGISYWTPASKSLVDNTRLLEERVSNAETSIDQNKDQIALRAKSSDVYTKTQTDGLISTEVSNRNSAIEQSAAAINLSVSQNYTTKTDFNNLEIGGRNLLKKSNWFINPDTNIALLNFTATYSQSDTVPSGYIAKYVLTNASATSCVYLRYVNTKVSMVNGETYIASGWIRGNKNSVVVPHIYVECQSSYTILENEPITTEWKRYSTRFVYSDSTTYKSMYILYRQTYSSLSNGDYFEVYGLKIEKGTKATDWSPAPEDLEAYTDTQVDAAKAAIKVTTDGISSEVSKISSAKYVNSSTTAGWTLVNIKTWATEGYSTSWSVVSTANIRVGDTVYIKNTDITRQCPVYMKVTVTNVNSSTSINAISHGYEDVLPIETIKSTINQSSDSVKIQANHVEIDGAAIFSNSNFRAAADAAYDTKGSAAGVQTNLDNLEIGGTNLLPYTEPSEVNLAKISNGSGTTVVTEDGYTCYKITGGNTNGNFYGSKCVVELHANTTYTYSAWIKVTTTTSNTVVSHGYLSLGHFSVINAASTESDTTHEDVASARVYSPSTVQVNTWTKISMTFTTNSLDKSKFGKYVKYNLNNDYTVYVRNMKLEQGTKATDWTPAPEDYDSNIIETHRIYYRTGTSAALSGPTNAWVAEPSNGANVYNQWTTKVPPLSPDTGGQTKYPYLYTCEQYKLYDGRILCTTVQRDDNSTIIDGGQIITNSITASQIAGNSLTIGNFTNEVATKINNGDAAKIQIDNLEIGGTNLLKNTNWTSDSISQITTEAINSHALGSYVGVWFVESSASVAMTNDGYLQVSTQHPSTRYGIIQDVYLEAGTYVLSAKSGSSGFRIAFEATTWPANKVMTIEQPYTRDYITIEVTTPAMYRAYIPAQNTSNITSPIGNYLKLEKGTRPTDWSPAPEDVDSKIDDASKTATNYIRADETGIRIANTNPAATTTTTYQHLTATETEFINNNRSVASFGGSTRIGETDKSHVRIHNGSIDFFYNSDNAGISIRSNRICIEITDGGVNISLSSLISGGAPYTYYIGDLYEIGTPSMGTEASVFAQGDTEIIYSSYEDWYSANLPIIPSLPSWCTYDEENKQLIFDTTTVNSYNSTNNGGYIRISNSTAVELEYDPNDDSNASSGVMSSIRYSGEPSYPLFKKVFRPSVNELPILPCFVYTTNNNTLFYADTTGLTLLNDNWRDGVIVTKPDFGSNKKIPSSAPSSNIVISSTVNQDCDGNQIGYSQIVVDTNNSLYRSFAVQRGSTVNALYLSINAQGQRVIGVSEAAPWRNAIFGVTNGVVPASLGGTGQTSLQATRNAMGLGNTTGALPLANGGTGQTATTNSNVTLSSGVSASNCVARKWGNVVTLFLYNIEFTAAVANGSSHDIGTVASGYRPAYLCYAQVASSNLSGLAYVRCTTAGALNFTNRSGAQLAANKTFSATLTFVIG